MLKQTRSFITMSTYTQKFIDSYFFFFSSAKFFSAAQPKGNNNEKNWRGKNMTKTTMISFTLA
jgi:hypothetical protein